MTSSRFALGIGGHQNLGDEATRHFVEQQIRTLLTTYQQREVHLVLYAALARGTDRLFVQIALELGVQVEIIIPCAEYEHIFSCESEKQEYIRLLHLAHTSHQLPVQECSDNAFLAAEQWIIDRSDLVILVWNGLPSQGRSGTGDMASYARFVGCPFIHIDTRKHRVQTYSKISSPSRTAPKQEYTVATETIWKRSAFEIQQYRVRMPDGEEVLRDVVKRPDSVLILPVGQQNIILLIEEYDFGAGIWQLTLPGGKLERASLEGEYEQAQKELQQELGYRAGKLEKLADFYSHPGYISHRVHAFIASDLEWMPQEPDLHEEIKVLTYTLQDALEETLVEKRFDPEAALVLWMYAQKKYHLTAHIK